jgi:hypothetical protein
MDFTGPSAGLCLRSYADATPRAGRNVTRRAWPKTIKEKAKARPDSTLQRTTEPWSWPARDSATWHPAVGEFSTPQTVESGRAPCVESGRATPGYPVESSRTLK